MKICKIIIRDFHQFKDFELDLTHPETGEPLDKVCLIGSNGTGKTKVLNILLDIFVHPANLFPTPKIAISFSSIFFIKFTDKSDSSFWIVRYFDFGITHNILIKDLNEDIKWIENFTEKVREKRKNTPNHLASSLGLTNLMGDTLSLKEKNYFDKIKPELLIFSPAESEQNPLKSLSDVPNTNLDAALKLFDSQIYKYVISSETISDFWKILIYHLKKRDNDFQEFQNLEENQNRIVREVREEFDRQQPKILDSLAKLWDEILGKAGLEFDVASASNPIQLTDNLKAYIKLKSTGKRINYNDLSTGIRNFIFKVGHIYSLYFNRQIESGFLLIDEPENSLFPDFLYDLVDIYKSITSNTQIFMATHSPIIAAQFEPYERFILEFDDHGHVQTRRGTVPVGDDPNDILSKDFGVKSLLGKEGVKKWERYIELRTIIRMTQDMEEKSRLLDEFMKIGNEYNFSNALS